MTKIAWTDKSWNPIIGCSKVSEGCKNCYAEKMAIRLATMEKTKYYGNCLMLNIHSEQWNGTTYFVEKQIEKPLHWKKPRMIFVNSMGDTFHESVPFEWIDKVIGMMTTANWHTYQILTKRPERMKEYFEARPEWGYDYDMSNIWLGVTAENQRCADERIPILLRIPAAKRFVSIEPCLEDISIGYYGCDYFKGLDWIIVGCESGHNRRECKQIWVESIIQQCQDANVPVFVKQLQINGKVEHDIAKFPKCLQNQEWPQICP